MYYTDLTILPTSDFSDALLMSTVVQKLHPYFASTNGVIGVSFPLISETGLGTILRLQSEDDQALHSMPEIDFVKSNAVGSVPDDVTPMRVRRVQFKSSVTRLARRYAARHDVSIEEALKHYSDFDEQRTTLPYITLSSASTGQQFRLFVSAELADESIAGRFTSYGLSQDGSTVMHF